MRKVYKIVAISAVAALLSIGIAALLLFKALDAVPDFYHEALALDADGQRGARDQFVARATALASDLNARGSWQTLLSADEINAWLALELVEHYPGLLPGDMHEPRVAIHDNEATIACRYEQGDLTTVLSLTVEAYLHEPNVLALRIRRARAGALPVPLGQVLHGISHAAGNLNLELQWRKMHGDPVALITLPAPRDSAASALHLQALELRQGELFVAGMVGNQMRSEGTEELPRPVPATARREAR